MIMKNPLLSSLFSTKSKMMCRQALGMLPLVLLFTFCLPVQKAAAQYDDVNISYNDFYENLAPYGQWIDDPQYGYVWSPNESSSFRPYYTNGYWVMTDYGNTWVSDYPWGWACFHYGRWTYDNYYGWLWIPGNNWGPAWVSWRYGDGFYGWAPLGPGYEFTSTYGDYACPNDWWVFIPPQYVYTGNYYRYWYGPHGNSQIIHNTVFINNTYSNNNITYVSGPRTREVEKVTHQPVQVYKLTNSRNLTTRRNHNEIRMYRPAEIRQAATINGARRTPPNVVVAPQPVRSPQPINTGQTTPPQFRNKLPNEGRTETPGTNYNQTAQPQKPPARNDNNPYEWDVNRPVNQEQRQNEQPRQAPEPGPAPRQTPQPGTNPVPQQPRANPAPAPQPQPRQAPAPAPQPQPRQAPQQQPRQTPAPTPAPAPQPQRESGGRR